ncbi:MAG: peptidylprolyl isomerase [Clostridia bacterium]|nr:peptidylprolyl isomerase [Clostridia bacterium]
MKRTFLRRIAAVSAAAVLSVGATAMFVGCTTDRPEITITYTFNGKDYAVDYTLSRKTAPRTVEHFIELADALYFDGLCVHNYDAGGLYTGGYMYENEELVEKDYFSAVASLSLTQSVFMSNDEKTPLNTVYGEFKDNGFQISSGSRYTHKAGALVMYYTDKGSDNTRVTTLRNDEGKATDGEAYQDNCLYSYNSATSMFYTYTGEGSTALDNKYSVFGMASDYENQMTGENGLLTAIKDYIADLGDVEFTEETEITLNKTDIIESVKNAKIKTTWEVPVEPIVIKSVVVNKY